MSDLCWLTDVQMARFVPLFPRSHGMPRVGGRHVPSGIFFTNRNGLSWRDAAAEYGPYKTLYGRRNPWSEKGLFARMLLERADPRGWTGTLGFDAPHLKTHRSASSLG